MSNRWVISWSVIDYWRWSMSNRWVIEAQKFCSLSITHRWHRLLIDVIDYSLMTHWFLIDCYTAHERNFSCFLVPLCFFVCDSFICVRRIFLVSEVPVDDLETQSANHQLCNLQNWTILTRQPSSVVQQKPKFHGKWFFHFKILENHLKLNLETSVYI